MKIEILLKFRILEIIFCLNFILLSNIYSNNEKKYETAIISNPGSIDPKDIRNLYATLIGSQIFEGLVKVDENLNIVPAIAKSWEISGNGKVTTFVLRKGVRFHNGKEVTSDDFVYSLSRIIKKEEDNLYFKSFDNIVGAREYKLNKAKTVKGIFSKDRYTLEINLIKPNPSFYKILAAVNCGVIPFAFAEIKSNNIKYFPVSAGPFKVEKWELNKKILLTRHDQYYDTLPNINKLVFNITTEKQLLEDFNSGKIYDTFSLSLYKDINVKYLNSYLIEEKLPLLHFIAINNKIEPFNNIYYRRALHYGLDKKRLVSEVFGKENITNSSIPYGIGGYSSEMKTYEYSTIKAKKMLSKSSLSIDDLSKKIIIWGRNSLPNKDKFKDIIENNYRTIGLNPEVRFISTNLFLKKFYAGEMGMFYAMHNINMNDAGFILAWYESKNKLNFTGLNNKKFDLLMEMAREESDDYIKFRLYSKADYIINDEAVQINLFNKVFKMYVNNKVSNFKLFKIGPIVQYKLIYIEE
ncbi:MAG: ABC transporter substrate-binding protein [Pseudomonadota bacterium]